MQQFPHIKILSRLWKILKHSMYDYPLQSTKLCFDPTKISPSYKIFFSFCKTNEIGLYEYSVIYYVWKWNEWENF